jgi:hypothetical protein
VCEMSEKGEKGEAMISVRNTRRMATCKPHGLCTCQAPARVLQQIEAAAFLLRRLQVSCMQEMHSIGSGHGYPRPAAPN